jgi:hypothetical protein
VPKNNLIALTEIPLGQSPWAIDTLRKKIQRRELPHVRIGRRIYLERALLEELRRGVRVPASPERSGSRSGGAE